MKTRLSLPKLALLLLPFAVGCSGGSSSGSGSGAPAPMSKVQQDAFLAFAKESNRAMTISSVLTSGTSAAAQTPMAMFAPTPTEKAEGQTDYKSLLNKEMGQGNGVRSKSGSRAQSEARIAC